MSCGRGIATKGLLIFLILLFVSCAFTPLPGGEARASGEIYRVNSDDGLNMRAKAKSDSKVLHTLKQGTKVKEISSHGNWLKVETKNGKVGYCYKKYLTADGKPIADPDEDPVWSGELCYINSVKKVKVHSSNSTHSRVKGRLNGGTVVWLLSYKGNWGYIETYNTGKKGYMLLSHLTKY